MSTILVVDDDHDIRETLVEALADEGYDVVSAADGIDALERLRETKPNAILLDLMMPRMNGMQFWQEMSREETWASIPIIVVSADAQGRAQATAMGAAAYLRKPMQLRDLFAAVARAVAKPT